MVYISGENEYLSPEDALLLDGVFKALKLKFRKSMDYNVGDTTFLDYYPFGRVSAAQMIYSKALRLVSLASKLSSSQHTFESVEDTYLDLIVYAAMSYAEEISRRGDTCPLRPTARPL
jgi:hypothetical protein